jgi:hypothetical protein
MSGTSATSTGDPDLDMAEMAERIFHEAPRIEKENRYEFDAGKTGTASKKAEEAKSRLEQVLQRLREKTLSSESFMSTPPARWHIKDFFYAGQVGLMVGMWKSGKTFTALHLAYSVAWGKPLFQPLTEDGRKAKPVGEVRLKGNVLYIPSEGVGSLKDRIKAYRQYYGRPPEGAGDVLVFPEAFNIFDDICLKALSAYCTEQNIVLIIVDTLASNLASISEKGHTNPENDPAVMSRMYDNISAVCEVQPQKCSAFFLHHPAKPANGKGDEGTTNGRGSGAIEASARFKLSVKVRRDKTRLLALEFNNETDDSEAPVIPFRLESVCVGFTEDGDPKHSGVFQCGAKPKRNESRLGQLLTALAEVMDEAGEASVLDWKAKVRTIFPDFSDNNFRSYKADALKAGLVEGFGDRGKQREHKFFRITPAGRDAVPAPENSR